MPLTTHLVAGYHVTMVRNPSIVAQAPLTIPRIAYRRMPFGGTVLLHCNTASVPVLPSQLPSQPNRSGVLGEIGLFLLLAAIRKQVVTEALGTEARTGKERPASVFSLQLGFGAACGQCVSVRSGVPFAASSKLSPVKGTG